MPRTSVLGSFARIAVWKVWSCLGDGNFLKSGQARISVRVELVISLQGCVKTAVIGTQRQPSASSTGVWLLYGISLYGSSYLL